LRAVVFPTISTSQREQRAKSIGPLMQMVEIASFLQWVGKAGPSATLRRLPDAPHRAARRVLPSEPAFRHQMFPFDHEALYLRRFACPYLKVRAARTNLILTKKQLAE